MQEWWQNVHTWVTADSVWWSVFGFTGGALFASRFVVQWFVSEKLKRSVIPVQFWYLSIAGSVMMLIYSIHLWKWPLIMAYLFPCVIYVRNLMLIAQGRKSAGRPAPQPNEAGAEVNAQA